MQVSNGQLCHINSPLYAAATSNSCNYALFLKDIVKINDFCILSVINQTQDEAHNINDNFWAISTLQDNKKLYITCLQYSYTIKFCFPYDVIYLPNGCEADAITFVLPYNNKLYVEPSIEATEYKLGFNQSYLKINNFSLMQSLNISSLMDDKLQVLANKILEMKHVSIFNINSTLTKLRTYPHSFWSSMTVKMFLTIGTTIAAISMIALSTG